MRMLDVERSQSIRNLQLYLTVSEARQLKQQLEDLLVDPEQSEHWHIFSSDNCRFEMSHSIVTPTTIKGNKHYTEIERRLFNEK